jgi:hypothetical protein
MIDATIVRAHQHGAGPKPVSRLCLGVLDAADVNRLAKWPSPSFLMKPSLFDHFRPFAIVNLELFGERGAAAAEHDAAFRLHAFDDCRRLERRIARLVEAHHDVGRRAGGLCLPQIKPEHIGDAVHPGSDSTECVALPRQHVISARPCSTISEYACQSTEALHRGRGITEPYPMRATQRFPIPVQGGRAFRQIPTHSFRRGDRRTRP